MDYDMKSTSWYSFIFGVGYLSCCSKKQEIVAQSIAAAEFIAATAPGNQALWIKKILCDLGLEMKESTKICVGNKVASAISHNPIFHRKTIHFNVTL